MPQYVQHGPDVIEFPDGMADADIAKALGGKAPAPTESSPVTRAYQSVAKPVTDILGKILEPATRTLTGPLVDAQRLMNGEDAGQVARTGSLMGERPGVAAPVAQKVAEIAVPQTPLQAGMMVGTMGAGRAAQAVPAVAALAKAHPALTRILGGTAGGTVGGAVGDEGAVRGAGEGFLGSTFGEILGKLLGAARPIIPGGKRAVNNADAQRIGETVGDLVSPLAGNTTVPAIRDMTEGAGRRALGASKEQAVQQIEEMLPGQMYGAGPKEIPTPGPLRGQTAYGPNRPLPPGRPIDTATPPTSVPSRGEEVHPGQDVADLMRMLGGGRPPTPPNRTVGMYEGAAPVPVSPPGRSASAETAAETMARLGGEVPPPPGIYSGTGGPSRSVQSVGSESMPLREANAALTSIGEGAFNQNILDMTAKKAADRRLYGEVARGIESGLPEPARPIWQKTQGEYSRGMDMLDFFKRSGVVDNEGFLNVPKLQMLLNNPRVAADLKTGLGEEGFQKLSDAVYRGAPRGEIDRMVSGQGNAFSNLGQLLRGQNTGSTQYLRSLLGILGAPNAGAKIVGKNPLALPEGLRTILDVGAQRGVDEALR